MMYARLICEKWEALVMVVVVTKPPKKGKKTTSEKKKRIFDKFDISITLLAKSGRLFSIEYMNVKRQIQSISQR